MDSIYYYTQGIPDFLNRLMKLAYEDAVSSGKSKIDSDLLLFVYRTQFELLHPALEAVRAGNYGGYEDLITIDNFKKGHRNQVHELIDKIEEKAKKNQAGSSSEGEYIDIDSKKSTVIPRVDLRNLKGLSRESIIEELKGQR